MNRKFSFCPNSKRYKNPSQSLSDALSFLYQWRTLVWARYNSFLYSALGDGRPQRPARGKRNTQKMIQATKSVVQIITDQLVIIIYVDDWNIFTFSSWKADLLLVLLGRCLNFLLEVLEQVFLNINCWTISLK